MAETRKEPPVHPEPVIKYVGGEVCLDFVNTVVWLRDGQAYERLTGYARFVEFAEGAEVLSARDAASLRRLATARPAQAEAALKNAKSQRSILHDVFGSLVRRRRPGAALDQLNAAVRGALMHLALAPAPAQDGATTLMRWAWRESGENLHSPVWPVLWSAAQLLSSEEASQVRICSGPDCGWMYVDRSRNGMRRWCEMSVCGTREKSRRRCERTQSR